MERDRERGREREREREREQDEAGGRKRGREEGGKWWKRIQELTYWLQWCSHHWNAWLPSLKLARESWKFAVIHWPWHASLRYLAELTLSSFRHTTRRKSPSNVWHSSCADGDRSETSPPQTLQQRRLTPVAWLMTFYCFSKSTVLFDSPSRKKTSFDWRVTQTAVLLVRSLARRFCFSRGGHGVTTELNIYTKTSFKRRKSWSASSIVISGSGPLNYLVIIIAGGWLLGSFERER